MEFTFDVSQTPIIGRRVTKPACDALQKEETGEAASPRRSVSTSLVDVASGGWKRPWLSQVGMGDAEFEPSGPARLIVEPGLRVTGSCRAGGKRS